MNCNENEHDAQRISLVDSLGGEWLKIPLDAMRTSGAASQTLAGIIAITFRETYVPISTIAQRARLPERTVKRHLERLDDDGWIDRRGRETTRQGNLRRTATIAVTKQTKDLLTENGYAMLPWWACGVIRRAGRTKRYGRLTWAAKAVLAVVMSKLASLRAAVDRDDTATDPTDLPGMISNMGDDDNFRYSLNRLSSMTGLHRQSVVFAKSQLHGVGIVHWRARKDENGGDVADILMPNWEFAVVVTPAGGDRVFLDFDRGSENDL